jgi:hypothetical protein
MILLFQSDISGVLIFLSCKYGGLTRLVPDPAQACRCPSAAVPCARRQLQSHAGSFPQRKQRPDPVYSPPRLRAYAATLGGRIDVTISVGPRSVKVA